MEEVMWFGAVCSLSTGFYICCRCLLTNKTDQSDLNQRVNNNRFCQPAKVDFANQMYTRLSELYRVFCDELNHYPSFNAVTSDDLEQFGCFLRQLEEHHTCVTDSAHGLIKGLETYLSYLDSATEARPLLRPQQ